MSCQDEEVDHEDEAVAQALADFDVGVEELEVEDR